MEKLDAACMVLIAIGESVKTLDKLTEKELLPIYPSIDWKGVMGVRDIIRITISKLTQMPSMISSGMTSNL